MDAATPFIRFTATCFAALALLPGLGAQTSPLSLTAVTTDSSSAPPTSVQTPPAPAPPKVDPQARALLDEAKAKILSVHSLVAEYEMTDSPTKYFVKGGIVTLERPSSFRIETVSGEMEEKRHLVAVSDGEKVTRLDEHDFISYSKPVRAGQFFLGQNFLVQYFFDARPIAFDPTDPNWGKSISLFDTNHAAYDKDTVLLYLGTRQIEHRPYEVVEIRYNTHDTDIRQQIYIGSEKLVYQVDTSFDGNIVSEKYRNFRIDGELTSDAFRLEKPPKMPFVDSDPVRLGELAPDFTLPDYSGHGERTLKDLLKDKKGVFICVLDGTEGKKHNNADYWLPQMRVLQHLKNEFESQGLMIVCVVGSPEITPDLVSEMKLNWMPDVSRFNYPIAIDVDIERGIQGNAFENFHLGGRNSLLLDKDGRVVFASYGMEGISELALYQAMAQIGLTISQADLERASPRAGR